jgi:hypothetical protein
VASVCKRTIPTERPPLVSEVSANFFVDRGCHVVSVTNPYGHIIGFLDRSRYCFFRVIPQMYSRGSVGPVPDTILFFLVVPGNRTRDLRICVPTDMLFRSLFVYPIYSPVLLPLIPLSRFMLTAIPFPIQA